MKPPSQILPLVLALLSLDVARAQVPQLISYQGRVLAAGTNFSGPGQFKFALVNSNGAPSYWSNNGTSVNGSEPTAAVTVVVAGGLFTVLLGDATLANMTAIPATVFTNADVRLRIWFDGGTSGFQELAPDQRIGAVGYAMMAANVADGAITSAKLADGVVTGAKLAAGAVTSASLADTVALGATNAFGRLDIYRTAANTPAISLLGSSSQISTYGSDGLEQVHIGGPSWGELWLNNSLVNNGRAVHLSANNAAGGFLLLNGTNGATRAYLSGGNAGGSMSLYQADGDVGVLLQGDSSGAGTMGVRDANGIDRVNLFGQSPYGGGGSIAVTGTGAAYAALLEGSVYGGRLTTQDELGNRTALLGSAASAGGFVQLYQANGNLGINLDGDATGASGGGSLGVRAADGRSAVFLSGDVSGGGGVYVRNTNGNNRALLAGQSTAGGGGLFLYDSSGTTTVELIGAETASSGSQLVMKQGDGTKTIQLDAEVGTGGGFLRLYKGDGTPGVTLQADAAGEGKVTTQVLQITGGSDLSEQFEIKAAAETPRPGMIVCIDPEIPGQLVESTRAYDRTVAGVMSGAGGVKPGMLMGQPGTAADGKYPVALTGRVYCHADATAGAIHPGDLLTTSNTPGHAMKVTDYSKAQGAIIGKAMSSLGQGRGLVLVLVSLQ